ncbi:hypothetical protein CJF42_03730 [Pseudoalteromonas sp. NBT06-2]|uniref:CidA/LrgA family protein n=1 Tax=Pseudoalteromonas sp. NBT06-2 TaxID=2025950 RepID=UPI000BA5CFB6|nr:CidA/LrgA family protein [Pseudoalteromonas sp. NBT06-2]PAJ75746.1 hypothetical protein CJF42_03730 [Pseudoalteromonas sp. NBT06-2]
MVKYLISASIILACLFIGKLISYSFNLTFPSAIFGMLILFTLLITRIVKYHTMLPCTTPLLKYMPLLFIPTLVGLMEHLELLKDNLMIISLSVITSCIVTLVVVGFIFQKLNKSAL